MKIEKNIKIPSKIKQLLDLYTEDDCICYNKLILDKQVELVEFLDRYIDEEIYVDVKL